MLQNHVKKLIVLAFLGCMTLASAREQGFAWDPNPEADVVGYRVYLYNAGTDSWNVIGTVTDDPATPENDPPTTIRILNFANVQSRVRATAFNAEGLESLPSDELLVAPQAPQPPENFREEVVELQVSRDMGETWETVAKYYIRKEEPRLFVRLEFREEDINAQ